MKHKQPSEEALKLTKQLTDFVNTYGDKSKDFITAMSCEHRTLQQSVTRLCFQWIEHCSSNEYSTDLRNESSHKVSKEVLELFRQRYAKEFTGASLDMMAKPSEHLPTI